MIQRRLPLRPAFTPRLRLAFVLCGLVLSASGLMGGAVGVASAGESGAVVPGSFVPGAFVPGLGDVPAMAGLTPVEDEGLVFDQPGGRIAQAVLRGPIGRDKILAFYAQTMPQLGWTRVADTLYRRDGEEVLVEFPASDRRTTVRLTLLPR